MFINPLEADSAFAIQAEALRKDRAATEESLNAEKAARYAADQEAGELQKKIEELEESISQERYSSWFCRTKIDQHY